MPMIRYPDGRCLSVTSEPGDFFVKAASLRGEVGRRTLRIEGIDYGEPYSIVAEESADTQGEFRGSWKVSADQGTVNLQMYGDPSDAVVIFGSYTSTAGPGLWAIELFASDEPDNDDGAEKALSAKTRSTKGRT